MTKTTPRGPTPSLIGGTNGRPRLRSVKRKSYCYRCNDEIPSGQTCIEIPKLGTGYASGRPICCECFQLIVEKTAQDLEEVKALLPSKEFHSA
jgi:hypothetical protein